MGFPDWTHGNAILYSSDDGNLIVSLRHRNWLLKIDYANGSGQGDIIWHLGYQGDFALVGGTDPTDWFYAQHGPSFASTSTSGSFTLAVFDYGDDRVFPSGVTCGTSGNPPCHYSTAPIFHTGILVFWRQLGGAEGRYRGVLRNRGGTENGRAHLRSYPGQHCVHAVAHADHRVTRLSGTKNPQHVSWCAVVKAEDSGCALLHSVHCSCLT